MLCLTVRQPWAELIVCAKKSIEIRSWWPRLQLPVLVAIHAGKQYDEAAPMLVHDAHLNCSRRVITPRFGGIIGVARFTERIEFCGYLGEIEGRARWVRMADQHLNPLDWWTRKSIGFRFDQPVRFERIIPCRGRQGFFELPEDITAAVISAAKGDTHGSTTGSTMQAHRL